MNKNILNQKKKKMKFLILIKFVWKKGTFKNNKRIKEIKENEE